MGRLRPVQVLRYILAVPLCIRPLSEKIRK